MKGNRKRDTRPELRVRSALHRAGARFRCDYPVRVVGRQPVRVDIAFTRARVAVLVDGCFWHRCPEHSNVPKANRQYWEAKLARNVERDAQTDRALAAAGWQTIHVWEHEHPDDAAQRIIETMREQQRPAGSSTNRPT
jgi:DNA mismatch endonuclease, patch repair protein